jgi:hypothetical protein
MRDDLIVEICNEAHHFLFIACRYLLGIRFPREPLKKRIEVILSLYILLFIKELLKVAWNCHVSTVMNGSSTNGRVSNDSMRNYTQQREMVL